MAIMAAFVFSILNIKNYGLFKSFFDFAIDQFTECDTTTLVTYCL
jgi:hypothetical protein